MDDVRAPTGQALVNEAPTGLRPAGFDPSRDDVWPFGEGVLVTGFGVQKTIGVFLICAVPDGHTLGEGGNAKGAWNAAIDQDAPRCILTFKTADSVRALAGELAALAQGMEAASAGETGTGSTVGDSPVGETDAPNPSLARGTQQ